VKFIIADCPFPQGFPQDSGFGVQISLDSEGVSQNECLQFSSQGFGYFRVEQEVAVGYGGMENAPAGVQQGKVATVGNGHSEAETREWVDGNGLVNPGEQVVEASPGNRGCKYCLRMDAVGLRQNGEIFFAEAVDLIEDAQPRAVLHP
jgi:hypothetical protein